MYVLWNYQGISAAANCKITLNKYVPINRSQCTLVWNFSQNEPDVYKIRLEPIFQLN